MLLLIVIFSLPKKLVILVMLEWETVVFGDVCLETSIGNKLVLKDVRHFPYIRLNLIYIGRLDDEGFTNFLGERKWKLTKGSLVVERGKKQNTLYVMEAKLHKREINAAQ